MASVVTRENDVWDVELFTFRKRMKIVNYLFMVSFTICEMGNLA